MHEADRRAPPDDVFRGSHWSRLSALLAAVALIACDGAVAGTSEAPSKAIPPGISGRTESYPRPPYSGATYYVYERDGAVICTKLEVCSKFDACGTTYRNGRYRAQEDVRTGEPYGRTESSPIAAAKLARHRCLTEFHLK